jgi:peptidoglycan/LPS O-acetylase OafA/YrhL
MDFLDVARGAAALLVVVEHGLHACLPGYYAFSRSHLVVGYAAIVVFFLVSGFVIPMSLEEGRSFAGFWVRRACRLFPVYWLSLALGLAYVAAGGGGSDVSLGDTRAWLANLALLQVPLKTPFVWGVYWTLPYEVMIYAGCAGLFALGLLRRIGGRAFLAAAAWLAVASVVGPLVTGKPLLPDGMRRMVFVCTLFGVVVYRHVSGRAGRGLLYGSAAALAVAVGAGYAVNHALFPADAPLTGLVRTAVTWGLGFAAFLLLVEARHRRMPGFACWLGRHSYPVYLLHPLVLVLVKPLGWPAWAFMPALVGLTLLLAAAVHQLVEKPGIALGRNLERRLRPKPAAVPAAVPEPAPRRAA